MVNEPHEIHQVPKPAQAATLADDCLRVCGYKICPLAGNGTDAIIDRQQNPCAVTIVALPDGLQSLATERMEGVGYLDKTLAGSCIVRILS